MKALQEMIIDECIDHLRRLDILSYRLECKETFNTVYKDKKKIERGNRNEDTNEYDGRMRISDSMSRIKLLNTVAHVGGWNKDRHNMREDNRYADNR